MSKNFFGNNKLQALFSRTEFGRTLFYILLFGKTSFDKSLFENKYSLIINYNRYWVGHYSVGRYSIINYSVGHYSVDHYSVGHYSVYHYSKINYSVDHYLVGCLLIMITGTVEKKENVEI